MSGAAAARVSPHLLRMGLLWPETPRALLALGLRPACLHRTAVGAAVVPGHAAGERASMACTTPQAQDRRRWRRRLWYQALQPEPRAAGLLRRRRTAAPHAGGDVTAARPREARAQCAWGARSPGRRWSSVLGARQCCVAALCPCSPLWRGPCPHAEPPLGTLAPPLQVVKQIWAYVKENDLQV